MGLGVHGVGIQWIPDAGIVLIVIFLLIGEFCFFLLFLLFFLFLVILFRFDITIGEYCLVLLLTFLITFPFTIPIFVIGLAICKLSLLFLINFAFYVTVGCLHLFPSQPKPWKPSLVYGSCNDRIRVTHAHNAPIPVKSQCLFLFQSILFIVQAKHKLEVGFSVDMCLSSVAQKPLTVNNQE